MSHRDHSISQITTGTIWKQLLFFFFPIVLGTFFQQFYNTIDAIVVGRFVGKTALASVGGSAGQIINLFVGFFTGLTAGASVIISQFFGAQNASGVSKSIHTAYAFSIIGSIVITIGGVLLTPTMLRMMNTPSELMPESIIYLRIYFGGILCVFIYNIGSSILRAVGDSKRPLYYLIICCIVNIILDLIMVVVFRLGVAGVAIATLISQAISALLVTRALMSSTGLLHLSLKRICLHKSMLKAQLRIGLPGGIQTAMYSISNIIIQAALNNFGTDTTAAWAAYGKLDAIFWMISGAFGIAITTFVGQNYGAGKYERVKKSVRTCLWMDAFISVVLIVFLMVACTPLFHIFTTDAHVVAIGAHMLKMITPCYIFFIFIEVLAGALRGMGDVLIPTLITMCGICLLRIVWVAVLTPLRPEISTIIFSYPVTWIVAAVLFILYYVYRIRRMPPGAQKNA
ncbi:MAG: MATE family efflux transporter [Lachnospiraceae bacterium]